MLCIIDNSAHLVGEDYSLYDWMVLNGISFYRASPGSPIPESVSALIISGGPKHSDEAQDLVGVVRNSTVPTLGICLGCMAIVLAFGGTLEDSDPGDSEIEIESESGISGLVTVAHRQKIKELGPEIRPVAKSKSGEVLWIEHVAKPITGVMFHPESPRSGSQIILKQFLTHALQS